MSAAPTTTKKIIFVKYSFFRPHVFPITIHTLL